MAEYKIAQVSQKPPREWHSKYGQMKTYKVKLENDDEHPDGIDINKKAENDPPKVGDVLLGTIEATDFGYRFKPDFKPKGNSNYVKDDKEIRAQMAVKSATAFVAATGGKTKDIFDLAQQLYGFVDTLKSSSQMAKEPSQQTADSGEPKVVPFEN